MSAGNNQYPVILRPLSAEDGGGWLADVPDLKGCIADGETPEEALLSVGQAIEAWIATARMVGRPVPEPTLEDEYSGKFTLRLPKSLHRQLAYQADREGISLNQYLLYLITDRHRAAVGGGEQLTFAPEPTPTAVFEGTEQFTVGGAVGKDPSNRKSPQKPARSDAQSRTR